MVRSLAVRCCRFLAAAFFVAPALLAIDDRELESLQDEALATLQQYLRVDTVNPPGNESRAVDFFAEIFRREGIDFDSAESAPGRGNIWARLPATKPATPRKPPLILLHHSDVVPADPAYWQVDPLSGEIHDGQLFGRGALDTKGLGILQLQAFLQLHRSRQLLERDVLYLATADEEAGGFYGADWLVENRPELFADGGLLLNEGGGGMVMGEARVYSVEVTQKVPLWLRLVSRGTPGHGSTPRVETATTRLIGALARLAEHRFDARAIPAVATYFAGLAEVLPGMGALANASTLVADPEALLKLQLENPQLHALLRNTCSITRFEGSSKINVVPPEVWAEIDCRLLPDQDPERFLAELETVLNQPAIEIERIMGFSPAISSTDTDLYRAIDAVARKHVPNVKVLPSVVTGFTDSHFFRDLGIASYGFNPALLPVEIQGSVHGNNERIPVDAFRNAVEMMIEIVERVAVGDA